MNPMNPELFSAFVLGFGSGLILAVVVLSFVWNTALDRARREAFIEGRNVAIDNAAMRASDMGHEDVRAAINSLVER